MDADRRYCLGCQRTLDEITRWGSMSEEEQRAVLLALPARKPAATSASPDLPEAR